MSFENLTGDEGFTFKGVYSHGLYVAWAVGGRPQFLLMENLPQDGMSVSMTWKPASLRVVQERARKNPSCLLWPSLGTLPTIFSSVLLVSQASNSIVWEGAIHSVNTRKWGSLGPFGGCLPHLSSGMLSVCDLMLVPGALTYLGLDNHHW